ncbi:general stress protein [Paenibacillus sp. JX-17]|uniref:General stress protein n=1 Tax=Paenibacillus lacisoli TaxID=3064525 RepID=A0ABT9C7W0_9BACL|nr:general stress protein [Paenibacillus sp. JX-17]MDO7905311.1 general stress protein [Paenibacillus sp. JX-17]
MTTLLIGVYRTEQDVSMTIEELMEAGAERKEISIVSNQHNDLEQIAEDTGMKPFSGGYGARGILNTLEQLASDLRVMPQRAAVSGPGAKLLAGAETGSRSDDLIVRLTAIGIPKDDARAYAAEVRRGHLLMMVTSEAEDAAGKMAIMEKHDVKPVSI